MLRRLDAIWSSGGTSKILELSVRKKKGIFFNIFVNHLCLRLKGAWEYIEKTREMVHDLEKRVQSAKNNVESMSQLMTKWCEAPLYERKEGKKEGLLNIEVKYFVD